VRIVEAFDHWTLTVSDLDRATAFYADILGWHPIGAGTRSDDDWGRLPGRTRASRCRRFVRDGQRVELAEPDGDRWHPRHPEVNHAGLSHLTVATRSTDEFVAALRQHSVTVRTHTRSSFVPGKEHPGNQFLFEDPDGNIIETYEADEAWNSFGVGDAEAAHVTGVAHLSHWSLCVENPTSVLPFYRDVLGLQEVAVFDWQGEGPSTVMDVGPAVLTTWLLASRGQRIEVIHFSAPPVRDDRQGAGTSTGLSHLTVSVDDVASAHDALEKAGFDPCITRGGRGEAVAFRDPAGNLIRGIPTAAGWGNSAGS
jgi:catechol 2,3-dioxygenase-like lactoylglutathione lyase family enzyme